MLQLSVQRVSNQTICGLGDTVSQVTNVKGEVLAYIGESGNNRKIHFIKPITVQDFRNFADLLRSLGNAI